jgi:hypothetical protein
MNTKLIWKKKWLEDKSGSWYSAKVPVINWEYIVDQKYEMDNTGGYEAWMFLTKTDADAVKISKTSYKTEQAAKGACEKHLTNTFKRFDKWINPKWPKTPKK